MSCCWVLEYSGVLQAHCQSGKAGQILAALGLIFWGMRDVRPSPDIPGGRTSRELLHPESLL